MSAVPTPPAPTGEPRVSGLDPSIGLTDRAVRDLARLAALICEAPFACLTLSGRDITWSRGSETADPNAFPHHRPFAKYVIGGSGLFEVPDTSADPRFARERPTAGRLAPRFYAGAALVAADGHEFGTLAVMDTVPRQLEPGQREALLALTDHAVAQTAVCNELVFVRAVVESAPVAIYRTDVNGSLTYVNPEYRKIFGLTPEQDINNDWAQGVHPDDRARMESNWADFCRQPRPIRFEYRTEPTAGALRYFGEQVVVAEGVAGFIGTISDFTELVAARGDLRKMETLFRNTCEQAPIGIAYADRNGKFLRCNETFSELLGFAPGEIETRSVAELTHGEDLATAGWELERLWRGEIDFVDIEKRYLRKDGSTIWVQATTALVRDGDATPECAVEFLLDVSIRKAMAATLVQNQTLLEAVIANLPHALLACDASGNITRQNGAAAELFSLPAAAKSGIGTPANEALAAEIFLADGITPVNPADRPLARALRGETVSDLELVIVPCGSTPRPTLTNARRLAGPDGQTLGAVAVVQNISKRKLAELELERVHKELMAASRQAGMAEIATNVLHNVGNVLNSVNVSASLLAERIKQSKSAGLGRVAALLEERSADLAAFISADERGRLLPVYLAQLAEQLKADQRIALEELAALRGNIEHIKDTVAMQQSYAKRCGVTETVAVAALVEDGLRMNAGALTRHGVTVLREIGEVPPITVDKHKVLQILVNLIRNAKYACDDSGRPDKILTVRVAGHGDRVRISVIDNGVGIPAENMARLFTHGFTTRESGHGFGLHSGALTASELGGSLTAYSDGPGRGATFVLELRREAHRV